MAKLLPLFILIVVAVSWLARASNAGFVGMLVGDALAIGFTYFLYVLAEKVPIRIRCNGCKKVVLSNTPWIGACTHQNKDSGIYSFLNRCGHEGCGMEPKTYKCHHCGDLLYLTEDEDKSNVAVSLTIPPEPQILNERERTTQQHDDAKLKKEREIELKKLEAQIKEIETRLSDPKIQTAYEKERDKMMAYLDKVARLHLDLNKFEANAELQYKDNPEMLKIIKEAVAATRENIM